jgi:hypothetical protein
MNATLTETTVHPLPASVRRAFERPERTKRSKYVLAVAIYLALALVLWAHVWFSGNAAHAVTCNCGDTVEQVWWLEWLPWALLHAHNPFLTNAIWARLGGVNAMSNTSWFFPAFVLSPITVLFGPVASYNVSNLLAPVLSGWAMFGLAGRFSARTGSRIVAGALLAFSPYVVKNTMLGHINLTLTAYLPITVILVLRLLDRRERPVRIGLLLGVASVVQFFTGFEVMALTTLTVGLLGVGVLLARPTMLVDAWRGLVTGLAVATGLGAVVLAYPLWFYLAGPRHVVGPYWAIKTNKLSDLVVAGSHIYSDDGALRAVGYLGARGPNTEFLGIGLVAFIAVSAWFWRRRATMIIFAGVAIVCWLLEAVSARWWAALPVVKSIALARFALPVSFCIAFLVAASIDAWWDATYRWRVTAHVVARRRLAQAGVVAMVVLAFVPLLITYSVPFEVTRATVPTWFRVDAKALPRSYAVLTFPFAFAIRSRPMAWQAETDLSFNLIGGWAFVPGANHFNDEIISPIGGVVADIRTLSNDPLSINRTQQQAIRAALLRWRPLVVVVVPPYANACARAVIADTLGLSPKHRDGSWVWTLTSTTTLGAVRAPRCS